MQFPPAEHSPQSRDNSHRLENKPDLSSLFFRDTELTAAYHSMRNTNDGSVQRAASVQDLIVDNLFDGSDQKTPLLPQALKKQLESGDVLYFSSPIDNQAEGRDPDYKLVKGSDGVLRLEPSKGREPLSDGRINIELETGSRSLPDAIKNGDVNLKESVREMMGFWLQKHPGRSYPSWWQDILMDKTNPPADHPKQLEIDQTPSKFRPGSPAIEVPPAPPREGWQRDYRLGVGNGYGKSISGSYYHGSGDGTAPSYMLPNEVAKYSDPRNFVARVTNAILRNDEAINADGTPRYQMMNLDDNGGISVGIRHWRSGGSLPELLNAWRDSSPQKFNEYFHGYTPAQINAMSSKEFAAHSELVQGMKDALADTQYQALQNKLMTDWVTREVKLGLDMGIKCERDLANYVGLANLFGQNRANKEAIDALPNNDNPKEVDIVLPKGEFANPYMCIKVDFSTQDAKLGKTIPPSTALSQKLAHRAQAWHHRMHSTGKCATAVQRALADVGMPQFLGSGDAWGMLGPLERSGLFVRVSEDEAAVGDLIVRPPAKNHYHRSYYGDISVVTDRKGQKITQTNDASYEYDRDNPRYDGKAVFLRYVGDDHPPSQRGTSNEGTQNSHAKKKPLRHRRHHE